MPPAAPALPPAVLLPASSSHIPCTINHSWLPKKLLAPQHSFLGFLSSSSCPLFQEGTFRAMFPVVGQQEVAEEWGI